MPEHGVPPGLRFVAQREDLQGAIFRDEDGGGEYELTNLQIQQFGLVDMMRDALAAEVERKAQPFQATAEQEGGRPTNGADDRHPPAEPPPPKLLGGYTDEWRWQVVQDSESTLVCIDNQPAIRAHDDPTTPAPQLQQIVLPLHVLQAAASTLS